ncbi:Amidase signature domain protein [Fusarium austroafricanum]|uniref:Amidase signature domain protein n=1 Tax=Fusarium austroafricanum TaxID=2364996 RepID=A0A8H4KIV3_9HYPO|nr:Amidase signature domain protein [Fusarium austroafricanum]
MVLRPSCLGSVGSLASSIRRETAQMTAALGIPATPKPMVIFEAGGARYVALDAFDFKLNIDIPLAPSPVTVVANHKGITLTKDWFEAYLNRLDKCDVFDRNSFLAGIIVTTPRHGQTIPSDCREYLQQLGNLWADIRVEDSGPTLSPGPYLYANQALRSVCRLYDDDHGAFLTTLKPRLGLSKSTKFEQLQVSGVSYGSLAVAVTSRAPTVVTGSPPQLRVAVKDCYFLHGMKTSLCNHAYYEMSEKASFTAEVVQALIKDGAQVLGLTKLSSMVAREEPMDAVDFLTAFNPRGDGYQSPAGSSSGSAASVAAYEWLDCALGTDTSGSGRRPAMVNGVWQFRPSHDSISLSGLVKTYAMFDTPCVFARSFDTVRRVVNTWLSPPPSNGSMLSSRPYRLVYATDYMPVANPDQMRIIESFIQDIENKLPATVVHFSIRDSWKMSHPADTSDDVDDYLDDVVRRTYYHQFYHSTDDFRKLYASKHQGRPPYVIPFVRRRWAQGATVSEAEHEEATKRLITYKTWLHEQLFGDSATETFVFLPVANAEPVYRDEILASPEKQSALDQLFVPPILGAPDIVIPIGEIPYHSRISDQTEFLPVVANLVGAPKRDLQLLQVVESILKKSARAESVLTGRRMFNV